MRLEPVPRKLLVNLPHWRLPYDPWMSEPFWTRTIRMPKSKRRKETASNG